MAIEILPKNFVVRRPTLDDVKAASEVVAACDIAEFGEIDITEEDIHSMWQTLGFDLENDAWVVTTSERRIIAVADMEHKEHVRIYTFGRVHPQYCGRGIGTHLLRLAEARARQHILEAPPEVRVTLNGWASSVNRAAQQLFEHEGFKRVRGTWHMQIEMDEVPTAPPWPDGITVRTFAPRQDSRTVFAAIEEAFQDHWGHLPRDFEQWEHWKFNREGFDPTLWFLAFDRDQLAGASLCSYMKETDTGWVDTLAVRRPWRRMGLGMALLKRSFDEFYRRGVRKVRLGVDSQNLTGATRLYERAGMHIIQQFNIYEKELRAGTELSTQTITN